MNRDLNIAGGAFAIAPSNTVDLVVPANGLYVTVTGNVVFDCGGITITLTAVAANTKLPFRVTRVRATGTTATVIGLTG